MLQEIIFTLILCEYSRIQYCMENHTKTKIIVWKT